jgi:ADP-ribosylglycohydrolase
MRYSIHSRFRGALLGMAAGEMLDRSRRKTRLLSRDANRDANYNSCQIALLDLVLRGVKTLIAFGRFDPEAWRNVMGEKVKTNAATPLLTTLPLALFYHENELKLRQNLQLALAAIARDEPENRDGALALGYAIATAIQAKSNPIELISQTIAFVGVSSTATAAKLERVKLLLEERAGLERAIAQLGQPHQLSSQIALAFFCCFSTPADFRLAVQRATKISDCGATSAIAGALSGAYNSMASIPATQALAIGMTNQAEVLRLCDALVAVWSGVYEQSDSVTANNQIAAIAAPQIVRRR